MFDEIVPIPSSISHAWYRQETAASITYLTHLLRDASNLPSELRVLDLCTGTGCIPLLLQHQMSSYSNLSLHILGVDISKKALSLAEHNHRRVFANTELRGEHQMQFIRADIMRSPAADREDVAPSLAFALNQARLPQFWDILISNPPYISPSQYWKSTTRSVRHYEPKLALVPGSDDLLDDFKHGDLFYPALLATACDVGAKIALFEVADMEQALRVARTARELDVFSGIEIWRDEPSATAPASENEDGFSILGEGNGRSVLCYRGDGAMWLGKTSSDATKD
jgi:SAM-dependent methyltransferase